MRTNLRAFSLIELLLAVFILAIGIISVSALFPAGIAQQQQTADAQLGPVVAEQALGLLRSRVKSEDFGTVHVFDAGLDAVAGLPSDNPLMFPAKMGGALSGAQLHSALNPVRILAGVPDFTFKGLRHFHASYLLNELGLPPYTIAQQLRHSDGGELIVSTYGHADRGVHLERISIAEKAYTATAATDDGSTVI
jgi:prepilin-type N-terminal cleavage/methylation domain-containing protein